MICLACHKLRGFFACQITLLHLVCSVKGHGTLVYLLLHLKKYPKRISNKIFLFYWQVMKKGMCSECNSPMTLAFKWPLVFLSELMRGLSNLCTGSQIALSARTKQLQLK